MNDDERERSPADVEDSLPSLANSTSVNSESSGVELPAIDDSKKNLTSPAEEPEKRSEKQQLNASVTYRFGERSRSARSTRSMMDRSAVSNTSGFSLRGRLRRLSRSQRKELLIRNSSQVSVNSILETDEDKADDCSRYTESSAETGTAKKENAPFDKKISKQILQRFQRQTSEPIQRTSNRIKLHIYDLIANDTLMVLPWGLTCEIGKCFNEFNTALHELGTGAYHVGVEVNGIEYAYGATSTPGKSGVFSCPPQRSPGYQYRTTIDFGERPLVRNSWVAVPKQCEITNKRTTSFRMIEEPVDGRQIIKEMAGEYLGADYDILRKNCCTFASDACKRLGIREDEIPTWFSNLAESGAMTQDTLSATVEPLTKVLSYNCEQQRPGIEPPVVIRQSDDDDGSVGYPGAPGGFEVVAKRSGTKDILVVLDSNRLKDLKLRSDIPVRRIVSW